MTDPEFKTELVRRLREQFGFFPNEESDDKVMEFTKRTIYYHLISGRLQLEILIGKFSQLFRRRSNDRIKLNRYRGHYITLLAQNACLLRRNASLRGHLSRIRRERREERAKGISKG